VSTVMNFRVQ